MMCVWQPVCSLKERQIPFTWVVYLFALATHCGAPAPSQFCTTCHLYFLPLNKMLTSDRLMGSTTFKANRGFRGGAIYNSAGNEESGTPAAITTFPADTVFVDNQADVSKARGVFFTHL